MVIILAEDIGKKGQKKLVVIAAALPERINIYHIYIRSFFQVVKFIGF
jgi:hypothetical protein